MYSSLYNRIQYRIQFRIFLNINNKFDNKSKRNRDNITSINKCLTYVKNYLWVSSKSS